MARRNPVNGVGVIRDPDAVPGQLTAKSYRPGAGDRRSGRQLGEPIRELLRPVDRRLPEPLFVDRVERGENLTPKTVLDGEPLALGTQLGADPAADRVERADPPCGDAERRAQGLRGRNPNPQPGERAGSEPDRDQVDPGPAAGTRRGILDLGQQAGRMPGPPRFGEPQQRLVQNLAVAPGAGGGVGGRSVEADDDQSGSAP